jgi:hypothetical protein
MLSWLTPAHSHGIRSQTELGVLVGIEARQTLPATILANPKAKENRHRDQSVSKSIFNRSPMYHLSTNTALGESCEKKNCEKDISSMLVSQHRKT